MAEGVVAIGIQRIRLLVPELRRQQWQHCRHLVEGVQRLHERLASGGSRKTAVGPAKAPGKAALREAGKTATPHAAPRYEQETDLGPLPPRARPAERPLSSPR